MLPGMDPAVVALTSEPRRKGAAPVVAPDAANWLKHPKQNDDSPETGSADWWLAFALRAGEAMRKEDAAKWKENEPCTQTKSSP
jgi:hypothetical protein